MHGNASWPQSLSLPALYETRLKTFLIQQMQGKRLSSVRTAFIPSLMQAPCSSVSDHVLHSEEELGPSHMLTSHRRKLQYAERSVKICAAQRL
ncbi:uncharacterized protein AAGF69_015940 isoform 2-T3 [Amazona ochrocephala]